MQYYLGSVFWCPRRLFKHFYKLFFLKTGSCILPRINKLKAQEAGGCLKNSKPTRLSGFENLAPHLSSSFFCFMWFLVSLLKINLWSQTRMQRKRANRKQKETASGGESEAMLYFPRHLRNTKDFTHWNKGTRDKLLSGSRRNSGSQCWFNPSKQPRQHSFAYCLPALTLRCQAFCLQTGHTVYALHPKDEPGRNLRSAVNHKPRCFQKPESTSSCVFNSAKKRALPGLILFGSQK